MAGRGGIVKRIEVVLGGQGGQGIRFAGIVLGQACAQAGRQVTSSASYGPEVRGSFIRSEVIISDEQITYPLALNPQYALVLTQEAYDRLLQGVAADGLVLFDPDVVTPLPEAKERHCPIPISDTAAEMGHPQAANMILLGAFCALSKLAGVETLKEALPTSNREANEAALERGFALGEGTGRER
jgi:2-oxoglutarate ferredoxin oxidoreductase subunit gamma